MDDQNLKNFKQVVLAGMQLMYNEKTFAMFKSGLLRADRPLPQRLAAETAGLMKMLNEKLGGKIPKQIIAPAAAMLLMEMGKFLDDSGVEEVSGKQIEEGTVLLMKALKTLFAPQQAAAAAPAQPQPGMIAAPQGAV